MSRPRLAYPEIKIGSDAELLEYQVTDGGVPVSVVGATVSVTWVNRDTDVVVVAPTAGIIIDAANGIVAHQPVPADLTAVQPVWVQFTITFATTRKHISPDISMAIIKAR